MRKDAPKTFQTYNLIQLDLIYFLCLNRIDNNLLQSEFICFQLDPWITHYLYKEQEYQTSNLSELGHKLTSLLQDF